MKIPTSNIQAPENLQAPNPKRNRTSARAWSAVAERSGDTALARTRPSRIAQPGCASETQMKIPTSNIQAPEKQNAPNSKLQLPEKRASQHPSANIQAPEKFQIPNTRPRMTFHIGAWLLMFLWCLDVGCWSFRAEAGNLLVDVHSFTSANIVNRRVTLTLLDPGPVSAGPWLIAGDSVAQFTDTNGTTIFTNVLAGGYRLDIAGTPSRSFPFGMPDTNTVPNGVTTNVVGLIGATNTMPWFYTAAQLDAILATNYATAAGTNVVVTISGHTYTVSLAQPIVFQSGTGIGDGVLSNRAAMTVVDWQNGLLESNGVTSVDIENRSLNDAMGTVAFNWATHLFGVPITFAGASNVSSGPIFGNGSPGFVGTFLGPASTATNVTGSFSGDVTGTQSAMVIKPAVTNTFAVKANNGADFSSPRSVGANAGVAMLSVSGGGNELIDMFAANNAFDGQLGVGESGVGSGDALWVSRGGPGTGTNVWGYGLDILGGLGLVGNPFWYDIPKSYNLTSLGIYWGYGPTASRLTSAYVGGNTNGSTIQPVLNISDGNPFNGAGGINITGAFTNSSLGNLIGTNADGIKVYKPNFGFQCIEIGDAYNALRSAANNAGAEAQQAPGDIIILNGLPFYISMNGSRTGDTINGQIPLVNIDTRNANNPKFRLPYQVANVWANTNANWKDAFLVDEGTGNLFATNGLSYFSNIWLNAGSTFQLNGAGGDTGHGMDVNSNASFNALANVATAWTFDGSATHRLGFWQKPGQFTKLAHGSGTPFIITMNTTGSDILANQSGNQTDELYVDSSHNVNVTNGNLAVNGYVGMTAGNNVRVKEGSNCKSGTFQLNGTSAVTVNTTVVNATNVSRILLTIQTPGGTVGSPYISSLSSGSSFSVKSTAAGDLSTCAYFIYDNNP
jgi:hypothetical protein